MGKAMLMAKVTITEISRLVGSKWVIHYTDYPSIIEPRDRSKLERKQEKPNEGMP